MDIGTERYLEGQKRKRAVLLGLAEGFIYPCDRCASTLVINPIKSDKYFQGRDSEKSDWEKRTSRGKGVDENCVYYLAWGIGRGIVLCKDCSDEIEDWEDEKINSEYENWPIEVRG